MAKEIETGPPKKTMDKDVETGPPIVHPIPVPSSLDLVQRVLHPKLTFPIERLTLRSDTVFGNWNPFKNDKKCLFHLESSFRFLQYLNFCPDVFIDVEKGLDKKAKISFKIYNIIDWETNNCNTCTAKYLKN